MSSVVSEGIILVAVVVAASVLSFTFMSSIVDIQQSTTASTNDIGDAIRTSVKVIHAVNVTDQNVRVWVKNVGSNSIYSGDIERADLYFGEAGDFSRISYSEAGVGWSYTLLGASSEKWNPQETLEILVTGSSTLSKGDYFVSFSTHNGIKDDEYFSIG